MKASDFNLKKFYLKEAIVVPATQEGWSRLPDIDREKYQPRDGLEGPIMTRSGKVVYYDNVEGKYYDPDTDMYLTYDEWKAFDPELPIRESEQSDVKAILDKHNITSVDDIEYGSKAYEELFSYYMDSGEMPYGTMKARDGDPDQWIADRVSDLGFNSQILISNANPQQKDYNWGTAEIVNWSSLDGLDLTGMLIKPENFDPKKKYPMIVNFYERSSNALHSHRAPNPGRSSINYSFYTSRGYLIFNPDVHYRVGYPGESAFNCVIPGITSLIEKGFVDEKNIGVQGHSWGGYQIAYLVTKTDIFKAAESGAPVVNMISAFGGIRWDTGLSRQFQYEHTQSRIGGTPWEYPQRYFENSPIYNIDKINTPLLIMHNDADGHVPWYQGIEFFVSLRRLGKPSWMLTDSEETQMLVKR